MAVWLIANNLWSSSETPENLGVIDGVQTYRVQSLMNAYNNCASNDKITLDPDSDNFKDNRGYRIRTVVFEMEANWAVNKSIVLAGGEYRMRLDGLGIYCLILTNSAFYDVDFVRLHRPGYDAIVSLNCDFTRCIFAGCSGDLSAFYFNNAASSLTDCAFYGNLSDIRSNVAAGSHAMKFTRCVMASKYSTSYATYDDCINLYNLTQAQINAIGFIKPPKVIDPDNPGYYTDGTARTNTDWESFDLHLKPDSPYATGNSLTESDGEVLDLDGVPRKPGGAKGAYEVAKSVIYFNTDGWNGTGALSWLGVTKTLWGEYPTYLCNTVDQAVNAAPIDGIVAPDPDSVSFRDANGFRKRTVTVLIHNNTDIRKDLTLAGGAYRLRLDGGGSYKVTWFKGGELSDVDLVSVTNSTALFNGAPLNARRCLFANISIDSSTVLGASFATHFYDCMFIHCVSNGSLCNGNVKLTRCTLYGCSNPSQYATKNVCVISPSEVTPSDVFVVPPPDDPVDVTDWSKWEQWDFRLKSSSPYATGNALTSADGEVYDLAGNKRKVGGAKGAYEVLTDVTHTATEYVGGYKYVLASVHGAPTLINASLSPSQGSWRTYLIFSDAEPKTIQRKNSSDEWTTINDNVKKTGFFSIGREYEIRFWYNDAPSAVASLKTYASELAPSDARDFKSTFIDPFSWGDSSSASTPGATSVCYLPYNAAFADTSSTVKKIIVPGWTHIRAGDVEGEIVLGQGATVETSGKLTLKNVTATSDELMKRVQLREPAKLTIDSGTITGTVWSNPIGTTIVLKSTTLSGKLPSNFELSDSSLQITENTTVDKISIKGTVSISVSENVFLSVVETFDLLDATVVTLESTGYLAVPYGTDFDLFEAGTNGSTDKLCYYGAKVSTVSAVITVQTAKIEFTKNAPPIPVLVERKKDNLWETVGFDSNICDVSDDEKQIVFRTFDGENFIQALPARRTFYLKNKAGGSFATAGDWTLDEQRTIACSNAPQIPDNIFDCRF